jgi:cysteinyl-tRNA synthetase
MLAEISIKRLKQAFLMDTVANTEAVQQSIINSLADDLNTSEVVKAIQTWVDMTLNGAFGGDKEGFLDFLDALLGIKL